MNILIEYALLPIEYYALYQFLHFNGKLINMITIIYTCVYFQKPFIIYIYITLELY